MQPQMAKFIRLFTQSWYDSQIFLFVYIGLVVIFGLIFQVLGAHFDDRGNFDNEYDTNFNDYKNVMQPLV